MRKMGKFSRLNREEQIKIYKIVAIHYGYDMSSSEICEATGLSQVELNYVTWFLRKNGVNVKYVRGKGSSSIGFAVEDLKKTNPELFTKSKKSTMNSFLSGDARNAFQAVRESL